MKKILILFTILIIGLTGCKKKSPEPSNSSDTPNKTQVETHTVSYDVTSASGTVFVAVIINGVETDYNDWQRNFTVKKGDLVRIVAYSGPVYYTGTTPNFQRISIVVNVDNQSVAGLSYQYTYLDWTKQF